MASICATGESTLLAQAVAYRENSHTINSTSETPTSNTDENTRYTTRGNTWYEKQQAAFAHFWSTIQNHDPKDYKLLNILYDQMQIVGKLPFKPS